MESEVIIWKNVGENVAVRLPLGVVDQVDVGTSFAALSSAAAGNEEERTVTSTCIVLQTLGKFGIQTELSCLPLYQ